MTRRRPSCFLDGKQEPFEPPQQQVVLSSHSFHRNQNASAAGEGSVKTSFPPRHPDGKGSRPTSGAALALMPCPVQMCLSRICRGWVLGWAVVPSTCEHGIHALREQKNQKGRPTKLSIGTKQGFYFCQLVSDDHAVEGRRHRQGWMVLV
ncbi:uncharacterized protein BKA78DRAFT_143633 [Phyllosticta capitalensis]|uniref:uncharacterized protein n=1 Tax=Phyllosticta capitalensis TaxID=121624 RepID=UPI00313211C1